MIQVYFLLILANVLVGLILGAPAFKSHFSPDMVRILENRSFQRMVGLIAALVGFLGLIAVLPGDLPILGNLLPSLSAMGIGFAVFLGPPEEDSNLPAWIRVGHEFIYHYSGVFSIGCFVSALLHFIFPSALFL